MSNWALRRAMLGMLGIITEALATMQALIDHEHQVTNARLDTADAVYKVQLQIADLEIAINKLPQQ